MTTNPYQGYFDLLDKTITDLEHADPACDWDAHKTAQDLLRRAGFVLANLLNVNAQVLPTLILPVEGSVEGTEDTDSDPHAS